MCDSAEATRNALERRSAEMDVLARDIAQAKERIQAEHKDRLETESALEELLEEVQQLSGARDREKASRSAAELQIQSMSQRLSDTQSHLDAMKTSMADVESTLKKEISARLEVRSAGLQTEGWRRRAGRGRRRERRSQQKQAADVGYRQRPEGGRAQDEGSRGNGRPGEKRADR